MGGSGCYVELLRALCIPSKSQKVARTDQGLQFVLHPSGNLFITDSSSELGSLHVSWGLTYNLALPSPRLWWGQGHTLEGIFSFPSGAGVVGLMTIQYHREVGCVWDDEDWVLGFRVKGSVTWFLFPRS